MNLEKGYYFNWKINLSPKDKIFKLSFALNIISPIANVLYNRGYINAEKAQEFLFPIYDPKVYHAKNLDSAELAVERILQAIDNKEKILISGDYDVDGMTSTSLLLYALLEFGADVNFFLPNRERDGYGLTVKIINKALKNNYGLVITVDNGTSAHEALEFAKINNIDVIVTDHHQPKESLPDGALYIVNPHKSNCKYAFKDLAGVGVIFKVVSLLYEKYNKKIPEKIYELFMLGTIADVVPLVSENRYWISHCLSNVNLNKSYYLNILKENAKISSETPLTSTDIAFYIAPQLNALGRMDDARNGVLFLISDDKDEIEQIGKQIFDTNKKRKKVEHDIFEKIINEINKSEIDPQQYGCLIKVGKDYPIGLIGLISAKISHLYGVPSFIFSETDKGLLKGSARSIPEINIFDCISKISPGLLISFGGHGGAAGLSLKKEDLNQFEKEISNIILSNYSKDDLTKKIIIDSILDVDEINEKLWNDLKLLEPFGACNSIPIFCIRNIQIKDVVILKDLHVKATIQSDKNFCSIIFFNKPELYNILKTINTTIDVLAKVVQNNWNNKSKIELIGIDIKI